MGRVEPFDFRQRNGVVPVNAYVRIRLLKVLHQVVGKRVVVIDDEDHERLSAFSIAARSAAALCSHSRNSRSGTESATIPAPACKYAFPCLNKRVRMVIAISMLPV